MQTEAPQRWKWLEKMLEEGERPPGQEQQHTVQWNKSDGSPRRQGKQWICGQRQRGRAGQVSAWSLLEGNHERLAHRVKAMGQVRDLLQQSSGCANGGSRALDVWAE